MPRKQPLEPKPATTVVKLGEIEFTIRAPTREELLAVCVDPIFAIGNRYRRLLLQEKADRDITWQQRYSNPEEQ